MVLDPSPFAPLCGCGKRGHAEAIIGGGAIERRIIAEADALELTKELKITLGKAEGQVRPAEFLDKAYLEEYSDEATCCPHNKWRNRCSEDIEITT